MDTTKAAQRDGSVAHEPQAPLRFLFGLWAVALTSCLRPPPELIFALLFCSFSLFNLCPWVTPFQVSGSSIPRQIKQEVKRWKGKMPACATGRQKAIINREGMGLATDLISWCGKRRQTSIFQSQTLIKAISELMMVRKETSQIKLEDTNLALFSRHSWYSWRLSKPWSPMSNDIIHYKNKEEAGR